MATITNDGGPARAMVGGGLVGLWRHPVRGWRRLDAEPLRTAATFLGRAAPLAAIGPAARLVRTLAFGGGSMGIIEYRATPAGALLAAVAGWVFALAAVALLAVVVDVAAGAFGGTRNLAAATKVAVFGAGPWWIAAAFAVLPAIAFLQLAGLYSLALLFIGAPMLMHVPRPGRVGMGATAAIAAAVLAIVALVASAAVTQRTLQPTVRTAGRRVVVTTAPTIAESRLSAPASDRKAAAPPGTAAAAAGTVPASSLQALLPARIAGFARTALGSESNVAAGLASASANATYVLATDSFTLTITDVGTSGALATTNSVVAGEVNRVTDNGFDRSQVVNGVRVVEKWNNADRGGTYSRTVGGRFTVEAHGTAPDFQVLENAVAAVDQRRLATLAR